MKEFPAFWDVIFVVLFSAFIIASIIYGLIYYGWSLGKG